MELAQTRCGCEGCDVQVVLDMGINKLQNTLQSATVKANPSRVSMGTLNRDI
jgi:activator of 2-hydroxyglutaryl-CoA dehydratase